MPITVEMQQRWKIEKEELKRKFESFTNKYKMFENSDPGKVSVKLQISLPRTREGLHKRIVAI
jgi:hypothetical protein